MTSAEVPVALWCWPGPRASAHVYEGHDGQPLLAVFMDPMNFVLSVPPVPNTAANCARFLRELAGAAAQLAEDISPSEQSGGVHRARSTGAAGGEGR